MNLRTTDYRKPWTGPAGISFLFLCRISVQFVFLILWAVFAGVFSIAFSKELGWDLRRGRHVTIYDDDGNLRVKAQRFPRKEHVVSTILVAHRDRRRIIEHPPGAWGLHFPVMESILDLNHFGPAFFQRRRWMITAMVALDENAVWMIPLVFCHHLGGYLE